MEHKELMAYAKEARKNSYSPYSRFAVGAALLGKSGRVYMGCNIENRAFGDTCCAERTAIFSAAANGEREFSAIAVAGEEGKPCYPCGSCRQVMSEFFKKDTAVIFEKGNGIFSMSFDELLPCSFDFEGLEEEKP